MEYTSAINPIILENKEDPLFKMCFPIITSKNEGSIMHFFSKFKHVQ